MRRLAPRSVLDTGCGLGVWLANARDKLGAELVGRDRSVDWADLFAAHGFGCHDVM